MHVVILSGGVGSRLWPVSRKEHPKPFLTLPNGLSILQNTFVRSLDLAPKSIINVTSTEFLFKIKKEWQQLTDSNKSSLEPNYILEPFGRNTAAAVAVSCLWMMQKYGADETLLVMPSDHIIDNQPNFKAAVIKACELTKNNKIVTFGVKPTAPETGYGYIKYSANTVDQFIEKPSITKAKEFIADGNYLWNSGIFCFNVKTMLQEMQQYCPELLTSVKLCFEQSQKNNTSDNSTTPNLSIDPKTFHAVQDESIDYAVLEKSENVSVVPCDIDWNDIGNWKTMSSMSPSDANGNILSGEVITEDVQDCYITGSSRLIAAIGLSNLVVVDTPDAVLIANKDQVQDVKKIYNNLAKSGHQSHEIHTTVFRPWGSYTIIQEGPNFKVKRIEVNPGESLSLQSHKFRSEHWVVISGIATVFNDNIESTLKANQSTYIPANAKHRLSNFSHEPLMIIEIQTGSYLGEDDIQRFDDIYGRTVNY